MKYMILTCASQRDYDAMGGKPGGTSAWSAEDFAAMGAFMESFTKDLMDSGELVETRGLSAPIQYPASPAATRCAGCDGRSIRRDQRGACRVLDR